MTIERFNPADEPALTFDGDVVVKPLKKKRASDRPEFPPYWRPNMPVPVAMIEAAELKAKMKEKPLTEIANYWGNMCRLIARVERMR